MKKRFQVRQKIKKSYKLHGAIALVAFIILSFSIWYSIPKQHNLNINQITEATGKVTLKLDPTEKFVTPNTEFTINLLASTTDSKILGNQIELTYSPECGIPKINQGNVFTNTLLIGRAENSRLNFTYVTPPDTGGISGQNLNVASFNFKPTQAGVCDLELTQNSLVTIVGSDKNEINELPRAKITITSNTDATTAPNSTPTTSETPQPSIRNTSNRTPVRQKPNPVPNSTTDSNTTTDSPNAVYDQAKNTVKQNVFQKIAKGWEAIFVRLANIF